MEKKLTKNEKGITLVALIITIIILLILAVVSIRAIRGDNILGKSEAGKNKYEEAKKNELNVLNNYESYFGTSKGNEEKIEKLFNKAYTLQSENNMITYAIKKTTTGNEVCAQSINIDSKKSSSWEKATISNVSSEFDAMTVYDNANNDSEIRIDPSKFVKITIIEKSSTILDAFGVQYEKERNLLYIRRIFYYRPKRWRKMQCFTWISICLC